MAINNLSERYGSVAMILHWVMAILIIGMLAVGLYMTGLPNSMQKLTLFGWHKEFGIVVLNLAIVRVCWRIINTVPSMPSGMPVIQKFAAYVVHYLFYLFMFAMPLTGWMMSSAAGLPVSFFGLFVLTDLVSANENTMKLLQIIHEYLGYALIATIVLHILAALKHHFINKDNVMRRMLP